MKNRRRLLTLIGVAALSMTACASRKEAPSQAPVKRYLLRGNVVRLDSQHRIATLQHDKIEGWMEAMTMDFPVRDPKEFAKLSPGQRIQATVFVQDLDYWIGDIQTQ